MTLNSLLTYEQISQVFIGMLQISGMDNFVSAFQTFAPKISSDIISYYNDDTCNCVNNIIFYTELYKVESCNFLYNYATQNNIEPLVESLMVTTLKNQVNISGKVASVKISDWFTFAAKVNNTQFRSFSTSLSGDKVIVFFI